MLVFITLKDKKCTNQLEKTNVASFEEKKKKKCTK